MLASRELMHLPAVYRTGLRHPHRGVDARQPGPSPWRAAPAPLPAGTVTGGPGDWARLDRVRGLSDHADDGAGSAETRRCPLDLALLLLLLVVLA